MNVTPNANNRSCFRPRRRFRRHVTFRSRTGTLRSIRTFAITTGHRTIYAAVSLDDAIAEGNHASAATTAIASADRLIFIGPHAKAANLISIPATLAPCYGQKLRVMSQSASLKAAFIALRSVYSLLSNPGTRVLFTAIRSFFEPTNEYYSSMGESSSFSVGVISYVRVVVSRSIIWSTQI